MTTELSIDDKINGYLPDHGNAPRPTTVASQSESIEEVSEADKAEPEETKEREIEPKAKEVKAEVSVESDDKISKAETDDYGLEIPAPRMYSEEDVQRMMRERLSRGQHANQQQPTQQQVQEAASGFEADPNSEVPWEQQLATFIDNRIDTRERSQREKEFQQKEMRKQAEFESRFTTGMEKYSDFREVTRDAPITDSIMMAARDMKDPAAFIYAAQKLQPQELKRISELTDPFQQAAEIGRLDERMKKAKNISKTAKPLSSTKSDISLASKAAPKRSIDGLIQTHAKSKLRR